MRLSPLPSPLRLLAAAFILGGLACGGDSTGPAPDPVVIVTDGLAEAVVGQPYAATLVASGGSGSFTWTVEAGALPTGLTLSTGGAISGTPTSGGTRSFTVRVTSGNQEATRSLELVVVQPLRITTGELPGGTPGVTYSASLLASGGTGSFVWALASGTLPDGLALEASGVVSGTPTEPGTSTFTVSVQSGAQTVTGQVSLRILESLQLLTTTLPDGLVGRAYSQTLEASGGSGTYGWAISAGRLPEGLTLAGAGSISGTPTAPGTSTFTLQVLSGSQNATREVQLVVRDTVGIATTTLPIAVTGVAYAAQLEGSGGNGAYTWALRSGALPAGLSLSSSGVISGTATAEGTASFEVEITSGEESTVRTLQLVVQGPVAFATTTLPGGEVGQAYSTKVEATAGNGTYVFSQVGGALPAGMSFDPATARVQGNPSEQGSFDVTLQVASGGTTATRTFTLVIGAASCVPGGPDTDGDRLPDCVETNTLLFLDATNTGTDPNNPDTDGDGISDGDEVLGTAGGLDLPGMGVHPLRQNILIEHDWFEHSEGGTFRSHRPTAASVEMVRAAFAAAPITNPDGTMGITVIQDYGQGGLFTGGNHVEDADGCIVGGVGGTEYTARINANFAPERLGYFHYNLNIYRYDADAAGSCEGASGSSGQAFFNDHRFVTSSSTWHSNSTSGDQWVANTIVHELGHNLNLAHGGPRGLQGSFNYKPNYPSVMNYRYQFPGVDTDCDVSADGVLDYSRGTRRALEESAINEPDGICAGVAVDWNNNGVATDTGYSLDLQAYGGGDANGSNSDRLEDHNDWANLSLSSSIAGATLPGGARIGQVAVSCPPPPIGDGGE